MSTIAQIKDGQILESVSNLNKEAKASNSSLDKDAFLQLLVAQMKYQDPLSIFRSLQRFRNWKKCRI